MSESSVTPLSGLYENWFLDYASYVILDRAIPNLYDGLKPVQRRILHAMKEMDDGRFHKVANIIGQTMQFHPHGDASIGDALVNLGQKNLLIDTQGNWGDTRTGDSAAAPRYIEARLTKFALEVLFNAQTTEWQLSYDGRKQEPLNLPVKFPLLLAQGVEGIAVGLSTKIMPHNFNELLDASIDVLKGKPVSLLPDFPTGGFADFSNYNEGQRGGRIRVRAKIEQLDKKTLVIREIPYGTTTSSLMESIVKANDQGKIKIKRVTDNTAKEIEILVTLAAGVSPDVTESALYAFTDCEVSIAPNACLIIDDKPHFMSVNDVLKKSTDYTLQLLERELEIRQGELKEKILFSSLEKIFIEEKIYRRIEEAETWEAVLQTIDEGLTPFKPDFYREITEEDLTKLTEIRIKRISKFDKKKADEAMRKLQDELQEVEFNLGHLNGYAINYFKALKKKYGANYPRMTKSVTFDAIEATAVVANNAKLYANLKEGFIGMGLKKEAFIAECADIDDIIIFRRDGVMKVVKIDDKVFVGKDIIHVDVFKKGDERRVYNLCYLDAKTGRTHVKRFQVLAVTRDREYNLASEAKGSKVLYFSANPNGEAEKIQVKLTPQSRARNKVFDFDFADLEVKGRTAKGNILTKYPVKQVKLLEAGKSTLGGMDIYYDPAVGRLNTDGTGQHLGKFEGDDRILVVEKNGTYTLTNFELTNRYDFENVLLIAKFDPEKLLSVVYYEANVKYYYAKRFRIETSTVGKPFGFVGNHKKSHTLAATLAGEANLQLQYRKTRERKKEEAVLSLREIEELKSARSLGQRLDYPNVQEAKFWPVLEEKKASTKEEGSASGSDDLALF